MTYKINDVVEVKEQWYEFANGKCEPFVKVKHFVVTDILFDGDIVLGRCGDEVRVLYQAQPYVSCMNEPIYFVNTDYKKN